MPVISPSTAYIDALRFGAQLVQGRFTVYQKGVPTQFQVPISTASFTVSRTSAHRRTGSLTAVIVPSVPPPPILPTTPSSLLAPFGNEVYCETGIGTMNTSGQVEVLTWVPMGLYAITSTSVEDSTIDLAVTVSLADRSWVISQRKFLAPYTFPATPSGNFVAEIQALLNQVWAQGTEGGPLTYRIVPTTATVPTATYNQGSDPWQAALDMAAAVGYELFFDAQGVVTGYPIPTPKTQPVQWNFTDTETAIFGAGGATGGGGSTQLEGDAYSSPTDVISVMTRTGIYNDVVVTGVGSSNAPASNTGTGQPVLAEAKDSTASSPTYVGGGMGDVPQFVSTNLVTSSVQAQAMANNDLQAALAAAWQLTVTLPPNPMFDIDDVVSVTRPRIGLNNVKMVIDSITHTVSYATLTKISGRVVL